MREGSDSFDASLPPFLTGGHPPNEQSSQPPQSTTSRRPSSTSPWSPTTDASGYGSYGVQFDPSDPLLQEKLSSHEKRTDAYCPKQDDPSGGGGRPPRDSANCSASPFYSSPSAAAHHAAAYRRRQMYVDACNAVLRVIFEVADVPPLATDSKIYRQLGGDSWATDAESAGRKGPTTPSEVDESGGGGGREKIRKEGKVELEVDEIVGELELMNGSSDVQPHGYSRLKHLLLHFQSPIIEEIYFREVLLKSSIFLVRIVSFSIAIAVFIVLLLGVKQNTVPEVPSGLGFIPVELLIATSLFLFSVSIWRKGAPLVHLCVVSLELRAVVFVVRVINFCAFVILDFYNGRQLWDLVGSVSIPALFGLCLISGVTATFTQQSLHLTVILVICAAKATLITFKWKSQLGAVLYVIPIIMSLQLVLDNIYTRDRERRKNFLKEKLVARQLIGLEEERQKTEYLLSLTLPPSIVDKLRDVGTANMDLISNWMESATIMFMDLKNFKEISQTLDSKKDAITLLNMIFHKIDEVLSSFPGVERIKTIQSKLLLLGGLKSANHLKEMVEFALAVRSLLSGTITFDLPGGAEPRRIRVKLKFAFGIQTGPLITGIVGKRTFCFEVYGDTVNTASRMLSMASGGQIVVTSLVWENVSSYYSGTNLGQRMVKGKGLVTLFNIEKHIGDPEPSEGDDGVLSSQSITSLNTRQTQRTSLKRNTLNLQRHNDSPLGDATSPPSEDPTTTEMTQAETLTISAVPLPRIDANIIHSTIFSSLNTATLPRPPSALSPVTTASTTTGPITASSRAVRPDSSDTAGQEPSKADFSANSLYQPRQNQANLSGYHNRSSSGSDLTESLLIINKKDPVFMRPGNRYTAQSRPRGVDSRNSSARQLGYTSDGNLPEDGAPSESVILASSAQPPERSRRLSFRPSLRYNSSRNTSAFGSISGRSRRVYPSAQRSAGASKTGSVQSLRGPPPSSRRRSSWFASLFETHDESGGVSESQLTMPEVLIEEAPAVVMAGVNESQDSFYCSGLTSGAARGLSVIPSVMGADDKKSGENVSAVGGLNYADEGVKLEDANVIFSNEELAAKITRLHAEHNIDAAVSAGYLNVQNRHASLAQTSQPAVTATSAATSAKMTVSPDSHQEPVISLPLVLDGESRAPHVSKITPPPQYFGIPSTLIRADAQFRDRELEERFVVDRNEAIWPVVQSIAFRGVFCQACMIAMALVNVYVKKGYVGPLSVSNNSSVPLSSSSAPSSPSSSNATVPQDDPMSDLDSLTIWFVLIGIVFGATGTQILAAGVSFGGATPSLFWQKALARWSIITVVAIALFTLQSWNGLREYPVLLIYVIPQIVNVYILLLTVLTLTERVVISSVVMTVFSIFNGILERQYWTIPIVPLASVALWGSIFSLQESFARMDYFMDRTLSSQSDMVKEEIKKSSRVLNTVLPNRIIIQLLKDPNVIFYEEFSMITVLHMDIAGFTAMSSSIEPMDIFLMMDNLFTYFDRLTEDFSVEKITTIGDAYVASSTLTTTADPTISAISVCIVALIMQSYVHEQLNESYLMKTKLNRKCVMRIGVHSGSCQGSIMGGSSNFRYDLMGDAGQQKRLDCGENSRTVRTGRGVYFWRYDGPREDISWF
ncbi:adenylate and guanylate cyclase catalytic domain-containing protein [Zopfochytrium polystomum]|nr:adenylate and guanylate cyclase catalytic domain-containing protein [Zopfochytrium polystomum]